MYKRVRRVLYYTIIVQLKRMHSHSPATRLPGHLLRGGGGVKADSVGLEGDERADEVGGTGKLCDVKWLTGVR